MAYDLIKISALPETTPDESQDIVIGDGDYAKRIKYADVKADMVGTSPSYTTDTEPYLMRQTAHVGVVGKCALNKLVGGSLGWNQLCNGSSVTVPSGHKYYMKKSGTASIGASTGSAITGLTSGTDMVIDLTQMFGSTIAEYIYSLESATAGAGVAWLSRYIDLGTYHDYDIGSIQSVQATAHVTTGFNQWDGTYTSGSFISATNGSATGSNANYGYTDYIPVVGGQDYYLNIYSIGSSAYGAAWYDGNKTFISGVAFTQGSTAKVGIVTAPSGAVYMRTSIKLSDIGSTCINISKTSGTPKNGDYVPYNGDTYPLGSDALRGIPQLVSNKLAFDGDEKYPDGTIKRKYGIIDLGTLTWNKHGTYTNCFGATLANVSAPSPSNICVPCVVARYTAVYGADITLARITSTDSSGSAFLSPSRWSTANPTIVINDVAYTSSTAEQFKAAMSGVYLVYPLETETTESSTAYQKIQTIDADGTESFTTSSPVPVGHETQTPDNILAALGWLGE